MELEAVSLGFGGRVLLSDLTLRVAPGERLVLVGASGSGKSTLLRLVAGFLAPERGTIRFGTEVVATKGRITVPPENRGVGMVFQDLALWPHLTVYGNLEFGLKARGFPRADREARIRGILELVGLGAFGEANPTRLSGGEQQRVALARALVLRPDVLLMDEPLSSLDDELRIQLQGEILRLHAELGFTLVYVTHRHDEAAAIADRVLRLESGRTRPETDAGRAIGR